MDIDKERSERGASRPGGRRRIGRMRTVASLCGASALAAVGLGAGLAGPALAATAQRVVTGTVETPGTTSFTLKSGAATITVDVTSTTRYLDHGVSGPTVANVTAGERVRVHGTLAGTNTVDASRVRVLPALPIVTGKVASTTSLSSGSFTITRGPATITVDVTSTTRYLDHGASTPTSANLTVGERVAIWGTESAGTNTVDASQVRVLPARPHSEHRSRPAEGLARLHGGIVTVRGAIARVPISCSLSSCRGTIHLGVLETVRVRRGTTFVSRAEVVALGSASYGIRRNATTDVLVHLDGAGVTLLGHARGHRLLTTATVSGHGRPLTSGRLVLVG